MYPYALFNICNVRQIIHRILTSQYIRNLQLQVGSSYHIPLRRNPLPRVCSPFFDNNYSLPSKSIIWLNHKALS